MNKRSERGVVSLITSILISLLFVVVVVAMVNVLTREASQSSDADEANRAFYAAESGVEDGLKTIKTALAAPGDPTTNLTTAENGGACQAQTNPSTNAKYTCLVISRESTNLDGVLYKDGVGDQIDLSNVPNLSKIIINWNLPGNGTTGDAGLTNLSGLPGIFTNGGTWGNNPAVIEATMIRFKQSGNFNVTDSSQLNILENIIVPTAANAGNPAIGSIANYTVAASKYSPNLASCSAQTSDANPYNCHETINIPSADYSTYYHVLRLRSRYNGAHFSVQAFNSSGQQVAVPDQYETIDVTAKSGSTERRVRAKVAIIQNTAALDYALFSDTDICKDFELRDSRSGQSGSSDDSGNAGSCPF